MDSRRLSRRLSYVLRHAPERAGVELQPGGWVPVDDLLAGLRADGLQLTRAQLARVVAESDKRRFSFDATGDRIRANQGHSVPVDLQLQPRQPPAVLYLGTVAAALPAIRDAGLTPQGRHHVHLSADAETARRVGARRGRPLMLRVDAAGLAAAGAQFFRSDNGIWLVDHVPAHHLRFPDAGPGRMGP